MSIIQFYMYAEGECYPAPPLHTPRGNRTPATSVKGWRAYLYTMGAGLRVYPAAWAATEQVARPVILMVSLGRKRNR